MMPKKKLYTLRRYQRRLLDVVALSVLLGYAWLAWSAAGAAPRGPVLDPIWQAVQERGRLRVAIDLGFRPFSDLRDGVPVGYDVDLVRAVGEELGLEVEFIPVGFDGLYDSLTSGRVDLIASALPYAPEQGYRARFSTIYFDAGQMLVVPRTSAISAVSDLRGQVVGAALGSDGDALLRRLTVDMRDLRIRNEFDTAEQVLAALRSGQLDAAIVDHVAALSAQQRAPGLQIAAALSFDPYVLGLPVNAFRLEEEVNLALERLRRRGFFAELNERWMR